MRRRLPANWRSRLEIEISPRSRIIKGYQTVTYRLKFKEGSTPRGFYRYIGFLQISVWNDGDIFVEDVEIDERLRRRGLGKMLYLHALKEHGRLSTNYHDASEDARKVWKSLCKNHRYTTDFWKGWLTVFAS